MKNFVTTTIGENDVQLKLTAARTIELEEKLGGSINEKLQEVDKLSVAAEYIAAALPDGDYKARKDGALCLYDDMTDEGKTIADYQYLIMDVLVAAGFMNAETVSAQRKIAEMQQKAVTEQIAKAEKALLK